MIMNDDDDDDDDDDDGYCRGTIGAPKRAR